MTEQTRQPDGTTSTDSSSAFPRQEAALARRESGQLTQRQAASSLIPFGEEWATMKEIAKVLMQGGFVNQKTYQTPEQVLAVILAGRELGIGPREALDHMTMQNGRLSPDGALQLSLAYRRIPTFQMEVLERTKEVCRLRGRRHPSLPWTEAQWTIKEASEVRILKQSGGSMLLVEKDNWRNYAEDMLYWRAVGRLLAMVAPDAMSTAGYSREVAQDFTERAGNGRTIDAEIITTTQEEASSK